MDYRSKNFSIKGKNKHAFRFILSTSKSLEIGNTNAINQCCVILWSFKEPPVSILWKKKPPQTQKPKNHQFQLFQNPLIFGWFLDFFILSKLVIIPIPKLIDSLVILRAGNWVYVRDDNQWVSMSLIQRLTQHCEINH
jgi:hypothetical protein